jgi:hypothetical protein
MGKPMLIKLIADNDGSHALVCVQELCTGCLMCLDEPTDTEQDMDRLVDMCPAGCLMLARADAPLGSVAEAAKSMLRTRRGRK